MGLITENFKLNYSLPGIGWGEIEIGDDSELYKVTFSYLSDPLKDLLHLAAVIKSAPGLSTISFSEEPGETVWVMSVSDENELNIDSYWFEDWIDGKDAEWVKSSGEKVFSLRVDLTDFQIALTGTVIALFENLGPKGYREQWVLYPFPFEEFKKLSDLIGEIELDLEYDPI